MNKEVSGRKPEANAATDAATKKPIQSYREGDVSVSIWARMYGERTFHSCTFERSYKDASGQWKYTRSFGLDDLGHLASLAQRTSEYLHELQNGAATD